MKDVPNAMFATCVKCRHTWLVIKLPQEMTVACKAMARATCPECGNTKANVLATAADVEKWRSQP